MALQEKNPKIGVEKNLSSKYLKEINCIIRGESYNNNSKKRNALITGISFITNKTCKIIFLLFYILVY